MTTLTRTTDSPLVTWISFGLALMVGAIVAATIEGVMPGLGLPILAAGVVAAVVIRLIARRNVAA